MTILDLTPPLVVGDTVLVRWIDGHTYETATGATIYSGAAGPSQADAADCIASPRAPLLLATAAEIKAEAQRRIFAIAPAWRQSNLIAHVLELTRDHGPRSSGTWPAEALAADDAAQAVWAQIKAIRAHSDALEANPPALADLPAAGWPY